MTLAAGLSWGRVSQSILVNKPLLFTLSTPPTDKSTPTIPQTCLCDLQFGENTQNHNLFSLLTAGKTLRELTILGSWVFQRVWDLTIWKEYFTHFPSCFKQGTLNVNSIFLDTQSSVRMLILVQCVREMILHGALTLLHVLRAEALAALALRYLFKDVCIANNPGRQRYSLPPE